MKILKRVVGTIWGLPQNVIGAVLCLLLRLFVRRVVVFNGRLLTLWRLHSGLSLGNFIFTSEWSGDFAKYHECGHSVQSDILGVFYLLVIGLPSFIWCCCYPRYRKKYPKVSYYDFYTEFWANKFSKICPLFPKTVL